MTVTRFCLDCGTLTGRTRCPDCRRRKDRNRGSRQARGYNADHYRDRQAWTPHVATGTVHCWRCGQLIVGEFDLGHRPGLPSHPEHPRCNRGAPSLGLPG